MTALAGLPLYLDLAHMMGRSRMIRKQVRERQGDQGWTDDQMIMALVLLNLAGGSCIEDIRVLEGHEGFCRLPRGRTIPSWEREGGCFAWWLRADTRHWGNAALRGDEPNSGGELAQKCARTGGHAYVSIIGATWSSFLGHAPVSNSLFGGPQGSHRQSGQIDRVCEQATV